MQAVTMCCTHKGLCLMHAGLADDLWRSGYRLNEDMRPTFISKKMASTILRAGKSINFLRCATLSSKLPGSLEVLRAAYINCVYCTVLYYTAEVMQPNSAPH